MPRCNERLFCMNSDAFIDAAINFARFTEAEHAFAH